jgi:hypothetical protein
VYRKQLLERGLQALLLPSSHADTDKEAEAVRRTQTADTLTYVQLIMESASGYFCSQISLYLSFVSL